jgi:hypothetical protein
MTANCGFLTRPPGAHFFAPGGTAPAISAIPRSVLQIRFF